MKPRMMRRLRKVLEVISWFLDEQIGVGGQDLTL
jgi:hypothetical protein